MKHIFRIFRILVITLTILLCIDVISALASVNIMDMPEEERRIYQNKSRLERAIETIHIMKYHMEMADRAKEYSSSLALIHHHLVFSRGYRDRLIYFHSESSEAPYREHHPLLLEEYMALQPLTQEFRQIIENERPDLLHNALQEAREHLGQCLLYFIAVQGVSSRFELDSVMITLELYKKTGDDEMVSILSEHILRCAQKEIAPLERDREIAQALTTIYDAGFIEEAYEIAERETKKVQESSYVGSDHMQVLSWIAKFYANADDLDNVLRLKDIARDYLYDVPGGFMFYDAVEAFIGIQNFDAAFKVAGLIHKESVRVVAAETIIEAIQQSDVAGKSDFIKDIQNLSDSMIYNSNWIRIQMKYAEFLHSINRQRHSKEVIFQTLGITDLSNPPRFNINDLVQIVPVLNLTGLNDLATTLVERYYLEIFSQKEFFSDSTEFKILMASLFTQIGNHEKSTEIAEPLNLIGRFTRDSHSYYLNPVINLQNATQMLYEHGYAPLMQNSSTRYGGASFNYLVENRQPDLARKLLGNPEYRDQRLHDATIGKLCAAYLDLGEIEKAIEFFELETQDRSTHEKQSAALAFARGFLGIGDIESAQKHLDMYSENHRNPSRISDIIPDHDKILNLPDDKQKQVLHIISNYALDLLYARSVKNSYKPSGSHQTRTPDIAKKAELHFLDMIRSLDEFNYRSVKTFEILAPFYAEAGRTEEFKDYFNTRLDEELQNYENRGEIRHLINLANIYALINSDSKALEILYSLDDDIKSGVTEIKLHEIAELIQTFYNAGDPEFAKSIIDNFSHYHSGITAAQTRRIQSSFIILWDVLNGGDYEESFKHLVDSRQSHGTHGVLFKLFRDNNHFDKALRLVLSIRPHDDVVEVLNQMLIYNNHINLDLVYRSTFQPIVTSKRNSNLRKVYTLLEYATLEKLYGSKEGAINALKQALSLLDKPDLSDSELDAKYTIYTAFFRFGYLDEIKEFDDYNEVIQDKDDYIYHQIFSHAMRRNYRIALENVDKIEDSKMRNEMLLNVAYLAANNDDYKTTISIIEKVPDNLSDMVSRHLYNDNVAARWYKCQPDSIAALKLAKAGYHDESLQLLLLKPPVSERVDALIDVYKLMIENGHDPDKTDLNPALRFIHNDVYFRKYSYHDERRGKV